jgi:hypothetical protein
MPTAVLMPLVIIMASYCINAMDRALFPLILPEVAREYAFGLPAAGLISTVFTFGMALAGLPAGYLMSRFAPKSVAQTGVFIFSAATIMTVVSSGFADMLVYRAVTGVGEAMQLTALLAILSRWFARHRAAAVGGLNCAFGVGAILGPLAGARDGRLWNLARPDGRFRRRRIPRDVSGGRAGSEFAARFRASESTPAGHNRRRGHPGKSQHGSVADPQPHCRCFDWRISRDVPDLSTRTAEFFRCRNGQDHEHLWSWGADIRCWGAAW